MSAPTLTQYTTGNPWVEVFFDPDDLDEDAATLRIYRIAEGRTWLVRGGVDVAVGVAALDFEVPFGVQATYRAEQFDDAGESLGYTDSASTTLNVEGTWIHNPLDPTQGVEVEVDKESVADVTRPTPGRSVYGEHDSVGTRIGRRRRGVTGVSVVLNVDGVSARAAVDSMLGDYDSSQVPVLCIRTSDRVLWPGTFFAAADDWSYRHRTYEYGGEWVQLVGTADEVKPPYAGLVVPLLTYDDLDAGYADYDARDAAYSSYTAQDRDYSLAGLAS